MRLIEITLKLAYLGIAIVILVAGISHESINAFLLVSFMLGVTLLINTEHPSYKYPVGYKYNNRVIAMRRIEGVIIILFAIFVIDRAFF